MGGDLVQKTSNLERRITFLRQEEERLLALISASHVSTDARQHANIALGAVATKLREAVNEITQLKRIQ